MKGKDSKDGGGIQDERSECLAYDALRSPSRGREYLDFCKRSETKSVVTRDRILSSPNFYNY